MKYLTYQTRTTENATYCPILRASSLLCRYFETNLLACLWLETVLFCAISLRLQPKITCDLSRQKLQESLAEGKNKENLDGTFASTSHNELSNVAWLRRTSTAIGLSTSLLPTQTFLALVTQSSFPTNVGEEDCVTSLKNVCVGGYV